MDKLKKLMDKKNDGKEIDPEYKNAKMSMLKALRDEMSGMMKDDLTKPGMKKVEVASDSPEGLSHGLDKAKEMMSPDEDDADEDSNSDQLGQDEADEHDVHGDDRFGVDSGMEEHAEEGDSNEPEHEGEDDMHLSDDDIAHLEAMLTEAKMKKGMR